MKNNLLMLIIGMIMIIGMTGCPYESSIPLSNSCNSIVDTALIGKWINPAADGNKDTIDIMKFNEHEYYIEIRTKGMNGNNKISRGRGFVTSIKNQKIINYCELGEPDKFVFLKYEFRDKLMKFYTVSDQFIKNSFNSRGELFDFFSKNIEKQGFYESPDSAVRVK